MTRLGVAGALLDGRLVAGDVALAGGRIAEVGLTPAGTGLATPALVDLQVNGLAGVDLLTADAGGWVDAARALQRTGVGAFLATLITAPEASLVTALRRAGELMAGQTRERGLGARLLGVHLEGPFLSPARAGAHPPEHLRAPDRALLGRLLAAGPVRMVTLAPELPGAGELIDQLTAAGVTVSLGHSAADAAQARAAIDRGARAVTHVGNAMGGIAAREPGLAGLALADPRVHVMAILDGVHLAPETARIVLAAAGERLVLVSDAIAAAGGGPRETRLGEASVTVAAGAARRGDGTLAGSVATLADGVAGAVALGLTVEAAARAASSRPAALVGCPDAARLAPGRRADLVVLDDAGRLRRALWAGTELAPLL